VTTAGAPEPTRFFFVHLQKTAGTTLFRRLKHHFGAEAVYPTPQFQGDVEATLDVNLLRERFARHRDEIRVVTGHFPLCTAEVLGVQLNTFTLLREPVERALSFLRHQREVSPQFADFPLEGIYADPLCRDGLVRNHMVRMLSLTVDEMTDGALTQVSVDEERLERAKANLVQRVDVVGVQEHFDAFCSELSARYGWDLGRAHVANRTTPVPVPESLRRQLAADNEMDAELYRFAIEHCVSTHPTKPT
jgi:Sulfotransferase family